jgi:trimeric autotransporter adhesin
MNNKYIKNFVFFLLLGVSFTSRSQIISTYAGNGYGAPSSGGYSGDGGPATTAELYNPNGMAMDASGNVLVVDMANQRVRMVNTSGVISTIAGNGVSGYYGDGGPATAAELKSPSSIAVDAHGNIYIADDLNTVSG